MNLKGNKNILNLYFFLSILFFIVLLLVPQSVFAGNPTMTTVSCGAPTAVASWPRNTFTSTCSIAINRDGETGLKVGAFVSNYTTTKISGNGSNLTVTSPEHRLKVDGPDQAGTPANVTTGSTGGAATIVKSGINDDPGASFNVDVKYTTYEADFGGTNYDQSITFGVYRDNNAAIDTMNDTINFTIANKSYLSISASPHISLASSSQVFSNGSYYNNTSNITATVKANNTWILKTKLNSAPTQASYTIPVGNVFFHCTGSGFTNLTTPPPPDSNRSSFAAANTYYNAAENSGGDFTTGTSDNINLSGKNVVFTYAVKTTSTAYDKSLYFADTVLQLTFPK